MSQFVRQQDAEQRKRKRYPLRQGRGVVKNARKECARNVPVEGRKVVLVVLRDVSAYDEGSHTRQQEQQAVKGKRVKPALPKVHGNSAAAAQSEAETGPEGSPRGQAGYRIHHP